MTADSANAKVGARVAMQSVLRSPGRDRS